MGVGVSEERLPSPPERMQVVERPSSGNIRGNHFKTIKPKSSHMVVGQLFLLPVSLLMGSCDVFMKDKCGSSVAGTTGLSPTSPIKSDRRAFVFFRGTVQLKIHQICSPRFDFCHFPVGKYLRVTQMKKCMRCESFGSFFVAHPGNVNPFVIPGTLGLLTSLCLLLL